jgi:hypothetical protein
LGAQSSNIHHEATRIAINARITSNALTCGGSMMVCTLRVSPRVKRPRCLTYRVARYRRGTCTKTASLPVPKSWPLCTAYPASPFCITWSAWSKSAPKGSAVPGTGHVLPNDEERATKKHVLKYIGPFANAFSAICQCEYSIQVARNHDAGILKTTSEGLRD